MQELVELAVNAVGQVRRVTREGREYFVAPLTTIVPGVLNGSKGALYYPPDEIAKNVSAWDNVPIVVYHPTDKLGNHVSAQHQEARQSHIGFLRNSKYADKLVHEGWFDVEKTRNIDVRIYNALDKGQQMELSTGLYTDNELKSGHDGKNSYDAIARNYRPDHLAILPDQKGACSLDNGCGLNVNAEQKRTLLTRIFELLGIVEKPIENANFGYKSLAAKADELSAKAACPTSHKAAGDAHMEASQEAAKPTATNGVADYVASGSHKVKAQEHYKQSEPTGNVWTEEARAAAADARRSSGKAEKTSAAAKAPDEHKSAANANYDAANAHKMAAAHDSPSKGEHEARAKEHEAKGDAHYRQSKGLSANKENAMTAEERKTTVAFLTTNCKCEEKTLNGFSDKKLQELLAAHKVWEKQHKKILANVADDDDDEEDEEDSELEEEMEKRKKGKKTATQNAAPSEAAQFAEQLLVNEKARLIATLVANIKDEKVRTERIAKYGSKTLAELRDYLELLPTANVVQPSYLGAAGGFPPAPVTNFNPQEDLLIAPGMDWDILDAKEKVTK